MKVLHFYHKNDVMVAQYVSVLARVMAESADVRSCNTLSRFRAALREQQPDIVHIHGCWRLAFAVAAHLARRRGARVVLSPHGQLEPWVIKQHYWFGKLPRLIAYQRQMVKKAYSVLAMGRMEEGCLKRLKWNERCETVRNALITESLTPDEMGQRMLSVYRKVLDSDQWPLMNATTRMTVRALIKAGQTGDAQWLTNDEYAACKAVGEQQLRQITLYACQENITQAVEKGLFAIGRTTFPFDPQKTPFYTPIGNAEQTLSHDGESEEERLCSMIHSARKLYSRRKITIAHVVDLSTALRTSHANEAKLTQMLMERHLMSFARRMMYVAAELTGTEEGFMPVNTERGRKAQRIENIITKHLHI